MGFNRNRVVLSAALFLALPSTQVLAHWCDDLWSSAYDIVVKPDSDTSPKALYVENRMGYQLTNFKLTASTSSGAAITLTPPTTLKVAGTLLPGERGIWKIASGNPAKVEDINFYVKFGNTTGSLTTQYACYPVLDASPVMVVKNDGSLFPNKIVGIPTTTADLPKANTANGCTFGDVSLGRSLQEQTIADWEDVNIGLDNLLVLYCAGRGSWGNNDRNVKPNSYCKDGSSTSCPSIKPTATPGSRSDYMRLWGAGALAIRKESLGARLPVFRERLKCGTNDGDPGIAGYTLFVLGYLGDEPAAKTFLQTKATAGGDLGTIAKAALYLMGDTTQKEAVQAGAKSTSVWVKVACAGALGIVDKDDASVSSIIFPEVKWIEPDNMGVPSSPTDNGMGMYSVHILELVAYHRRGWVYRGNANGPVSFYGEADVATGGAPADGGTTVPGSGGVVGTGGTSTPVATGGITGGRDASVGTGGTTATGGAAPSSGGVTPATGGLTGGGVVPPGGQVAGGATSPKATGGVASTGGVSDPIITPSTGGASAPGGNTVTGGGQGSGCNCRLSGPREVPVLMFPTLVGLALLLLRRRRR